MTNILPERAHMARSLSPERVGPTVLATVEVSLARAAALAGNDAARLHAMVIKATANALTGHRLFTWAYNGAYRVFETDRIDIRAPARPGNDARLVVVRDADKKSLDEVDAGLRRGAATPPARDEFARVTGLADAGRRTVHSMRMAFSRSHEQAYWDSCRDKAGTFFLSNVGPLGIRDFAGPVRMPSIVELGVCAPFEKTVLENGALAKRPFLHLVGRLDHRMTDVAQTARFLQDVRKNLENPESSLGPTR